MAAASNLMMRNSPPAEGRAGKQQISTLRGEIRRAGAGLWKLRLRWTIYFAALPALAVITLLLAQWGHFPGAPPFTRADCQVLVVVLGAGLFTGAVGACLGALLARRAGRLRFGYRLEALPTPEVMEILLPLCRDASADVRAMATPLVREFCRRTEIAYAASPNARGDEASPAEEQA